MSTTEAIGTPDATTDHRAEFIQGLRDLADFVSRNPDVPVPRIETTINVPVNNRSDLATFARAAGSVEKDYSGNWAVLRKTFGRISLDVYASREQVCERVQVGTATITEEVPDPDRLAELPTVTVTREEPVFEWRCDEPLLAPDRAAAQDDPRGEADR